VGLVGYLIRRPLFVCLFGVYLFVSFFACFFAYLNVPQKPKQGEHLYYPLSVTYSTKACVC
jgi:hypothetical protein